jgi:hypothetical protein
MGKYDIGKTKKLRFARFGGLSSVNQRGYRASMPDFHSPPASRGFYCFVWPFYELFLLGASETKDPYMIGAKFSYVRDAKGEIIGDKHPDYKRITEMSDYHSKYWTAESKAWKDFKRRNEWPTWDFDENDDAAWDYYKTKTDMLCAKWYAECSHLPRWVLVTKPSPRIFEYDGLLWHHLGNNIGNGTIVARKGKWVKTSVTDYRDALEVEMHRAKRDQMMWMSEGKKNKFIPGKNAFRIASKDHLECFIEKI